MRAAEILRKLADIIDHAEQPDSTTGQMSPFTKGDDANRFKQTMDLISSEEDQTYANEPGEEYADVASVTIHAGGGVNGPKDPSDLRVQHPSLFPGHQHNPGA
jgi:hypothetical protein